MPTGRLVSAPQDRLKIAGIDKGSMFRAIDRWGNVSRRPLDPKTVNDVVNLRVEQAGLDPAEFSAHGLRRAI